ncbi:MAG: zf-TFIIB domain-containing protein [Candidatus Rokubacteria bacterium]|nr:zf-TFIIB domain-containing protein [Candidatus Rokubacteria bacterium]
MTSRQMERGGMLAALLLILALLPTLAQAQIYRWMDDAGAVHYSQGLDSVPERYRSQAQSLDLGPPRPAPAPAERRPSPPPSLGPAEPLPSPPRDKWGPTGALPDITRVSFPRGSYILVEARINGQGPVKLLLDTGSHQTHVSARAVRTLGISAPSYPCRSCEVEMTGGTRVVREVQVLSLRVGDAEMAGPAFMDETDPYEPPGAVGVLGRSFLDHFRVTMDFGQQVVVLVPATVSGAGTHEPSLAVADVTRMPFPPHPYILVRSRINGRGPITLVLDTGAPNTWLSAKALRSLEISTENAERQTLPGRNVRAVRVDVASVAVGAAKVGPLRIGAFVEMETVAGADGLLGLDFLRNFTVTIDPTERVVTLGRTDIAQSRTVTTRPQEPVVTPRRPGDPHVPSAMPPQLERWSLLGLAALVALALGALRIVRRRREGSRWAVRQGHLTCPQCSARLSRLVDDQGIEVNWCESCKGTWHDKGILDEFSRESDLPRLLQEQPTSSRYPSDRRCPRCDVPMEKSALGAEKLVVERCRSCPGLWLDRGEVAKLSQPSPARPQPAMTCPQCRSALEERAGPEGVVAAVCGQCWGVWYDRGELSFLASRHGELKGLLARPALQGKVSAARCPRCEGLLEEGGLGPGQLRVERCQNCAGVWLAAEEKGRLDEIIARRRPPVGRTLGTPDGLTVRFSRTKPALVVLGSLSLVVLVTGAGLFDGGDWWELAWAVSLMALIGFGLLYVLYRVCRRRSALIVNREGIVDNTAPFSAGMTRWADIAELLVQGSPRKAHLTLWIVPERSNLKRRVRDIRIPQTALRMSPGMFVQEIRRYCPETVQVHWKP